MLHFKKLFLFPLISITFLALTCKKSPVENEEILSRRDYVWTIDTLSILSPNNHYEGIWGNNPENVWCVGLLNQEENLIHFNGKNWSLYDYPADGHYISEGWTIAGFPSGEFWIGTFAGDIWHFVPGLFKRYPMKIDTFMLCDFQKFWVNDYDDIYAIGGSFTKDFIACSQILHYDGNDWKYILGPEPDSVDLYNIKKGTKDTQNYLLLGSRRVSNGKQDSVYIYEFDGKKLKLLMSKPESDGIDLFESEGKVFLSIDRTMTLYRYIGNGFVPEKDFSGTEVNALRMFGKSENDFFMVTHSGIGHYNGKDVQTVFNLPYQFFIRDGLIFDKEVFFVCYSFEKAFSFVIHGKLKE